MTSYDLNIIAMIGLVASIYLCSQYFKKYTKLRNGLKGLKSDMKNHTIKHGVDDALWIKFVEGSRKLLGESHDSEKE